MSPEQVSFPHSFITSCLLACIQSPSGKVYSEREEFAPKIFRREAKQFGKNYVTESVSISLNYSKHKKCLHFYREAENMLRQPNL